MSVTPQRINPAYRGATAGPRSVTRSLDLDEVLARKAQWLAQPPSADRARALKTIRNQLASIANRVENRP